MPNSIIKKKKRIAILDDSQGRDFHRYLSSLDHDYDVVVYTKPDDKIKHVRCSVKLIKDFSQGDFVILLAVINYTHKSDPPITVLHGLRALFEVKNKTASNINSMINCSIMDHSSPI